MKWIKLIIFTVFGLNGLIFSPVYGAPKAMKLSSSAFQPNGEIPRLYTCQGKDISVPLHWEEVPEGTQSLVLIIDDPDAPDPKAPQMTWVHWVLYNIPPTATGLPEAVKSNALPKGTLEGTNDWKRTGYGGPCPPIGQHRYFHKLYALNKILPNLNHPSKKEVEDAMRGHVLEKVELIGVYEKE